MVDLTKSKKTTKRRKVPTKGSPALKAYWTASTSEASLFRFVCDITMKADYVSYIIRQALDGKKDYAKINEIDLARTDPGPATKYLRKKSQSLIEMFLTRVIDNFQTYLVDLIREVLKSRPEMMISSDKNFSLADIMKYKRIEDFVDDVIEGKVNSLSYEGFSALSDWCEKRGIVIHVPKTRMAEVVELIATRNIITHNRGRIDARYLRTVKNAKQKVGVQRSLDVDQLVNAGQLLTNIVLRTDRAACKKFGLCEIELKDAVAAKAAIEAPPAVEAPKEIQTKLIAAEK